MSTSLCCAYDDDEGSGCRGEDADAALPPAKLSAADAEETPSEEADKEEAAAFPAEVAV